MSDIAGHGHTHWISEEHLAGKEEELNLMETSICFVYIFGKLLQPACEDY